MRAFLIGSSTALVSFGLGFVATRWLGEEVKPADASRLIAAADANAGLSAKTNIAAKETGAQALLALAKKQPELSSDHAAYAALLAMEAKDFAAGAHDFAAKLKAMSSWGHAVQIGDAWMDRWLELDRAAALDFIKTSKILEEHVGKGGSGWNAQALGNSNWTGVFQALARRELEWAGDYVTALKEGPKRDRAVFELLEVAGELNQTLAKQLFEKFSEGANRAAALRGYVFGLTQVDETTAFGVAAREPAGPLRVELLTRAAESAKIGNVRQMLGLIEEPELRQKLAYYALYGIWYRTRADAVEWIKEETARLAKRSADDDTGFWATAILQSTDATKIPGLVEWASAGNSDAHRKIFASMAGAWAGSEPAAARQWLSANASRVDAKMMEDMDEVFTTLAENDLAGMREWVEALPGGPLQDRARFQLALGAGREGDLARVQAVYATMHSSDGDGKKAKEVAAILAKQDGGVAAEWALQLPSGAARATAIAEVASEWSKRDLPAVGAWLESMPEGMERDATMKAYAAMVGYTDPRAGAACVEQIADRAIREKAAAEVYSSWRHEDPAGALAWLRNLGGVAEEWKAQRLKDSR